MALIVPSQLDALAESIVPALPTNPNPTQTAARAAAIAQTKDLAQKMFQYIVDQIEVKGVSVDTGTLHAAAPPTVAPQDGGLVLYNSQLKADVNSKTLTQNNDGKGRVL